MTVQAAKYCLPCSLLFMGLIMATVLVSCDRETAERGPLSAVQAEQTDQKQSSGPAWVVDPADPGPDVPPVGRSLFDYLVTAENGEQMRYKVPFPFSALVRRVEQQLGAGDQISHLKRVLIPLNRSLQRNAAEPEYFTYPRAVIGVDSEPSMRAGFSGLLLKDRLFLGYQEKANILEVISYNEAAGRFEFQVVQDYGPGKTPKILYANRALCTACHQNQSPIFSRPLWDETNANPKIAARLDRQRAELYGFPLRQGIDVPNAIDDATDRANEFSAYQLLWQEGCEHVRSPSDSIQCRADVFGFLLQSRLNGSPPALRRSSRYREEFAPHFAASWKEKWPQGLLIPNPDLLNRNPLDYVQTISSDSGELLIPATGYDNTRERAMIRSIFEPTIAREPLAVWSASRETPEAVDRFVTGLSRFLADVDIERLDTYLFRQATLSGAAVHRYQSRCEADVRERSKSVERITFRCWEPEQRRQDHNGFSMEGILYLKAGTVVDGAIDRLVTGEGHALTGLNITSGTMRSKNRRRIGRIEVTQKDPALHARLADGHAIKALTFQFGIPGKEQREAGRAADLVGSATMTVLQDYASVHQAIDAMARDTLAGKSDVFARKPFRRATAMKALYDQLNMPPLKWCCEDAHNMPEPVSTTEATLHDFDAPARDKNISPVFKVFQRYCAQCHHEDLAFPPNFLHGSPSKVKEEIDHCAERIFFRLEMWALAPHERQEAPMPPATALQRLHLSPEQWASHPDLAWLKSYTAAVLKSQGGKPTRLEDLATKGYDNLQACVPPTRAAVAAASDAIRE